ncbi:TonB-dependent receptor [Phenylobacterium sp. J426]|uniref:TonB-dependent receptor plug domain-containing protein n=1 Tax=Phenylobacterium sp. J426 TaxID=2898439 RepID=UPI002151D251|nr:TonB-dependent receptor [Phenylobacterium sp. J426]MCR5873335.1 TonB-dependent receptor [Phenylobacterium sp. J426]
MLIANILAQAAVAAAPPAAVPAQPQQGVISYPASFFEGQQASNAAEMLARVPGFNLDTGDNVRGFEGAAGNVLIDGQRPASKSDNLEEILRRVPVSAVERIDIIRGGAPGIDMQGKSVLANVVRKQGASFRGLFAVANNHLWDGRNMHGMRLELSGGDGQRTWETTIRYGYGNDDGGQFGPSVRIAPDGRILRRADYESESDGLQQTITAGYSQPLLGGRLTLNGRAFWDSWKSENTIRYLEPADLATANITSPYDEFETEVGARYNRDFGPRTKLEVVALRSDSDFHRFDLFRQGAVVDDFRNERTYNETIGRAVLKHQRSATLSFEAGGETALNKLDSQSEQFTNGVRQPLPAGDVQVEELRGEAFAKVVWRPAPQWTLDGGLRFEASDISSDGDVVLEKSLSFLKPRLAVAWQPLPSTQLRGRIERVVGQLNFDDFVAGADFEEGTGVTVGNPDLDPEQAWVGEIALEQRFWKSGAVTVTYRHSELTDVIDRGPERAPDGKIFDRPTNIGDGTKDELIVTLQVPTDPLGWKGGILQGELNRRWSEVIDPTTLTKREISRLRPLEWEARYTQDLPQWGASVGVAVFSGWSQTTYRYNSVTDVKLHNAYVTAWVDKRLSPDTILRVEFGNLAERGIRFNTQSYNGDRRTGSLAYTDDRDLTPRTHALCARPKDFRRLARPASPGSREGRGAIRGLRLFQRCGLT